MTRSREAREQQAIDHEVRLSRSRAIIHDYVVGQQGREEARDSWQQTAWMRGQVADMIAHASRDELESLGLTDDMIRELRLGTSLQAAWEAQHLPPDSMSPDSARPASVGGAYKPASTTGSEARSRPRR